MVVFDLVGQPSGDAVLTIDLRHCALGEPHFDAGHAATDVHASLKVDEHSLFGFALGFENRDLADLSHWLGPFGERRWPCAPASYAPLILWSLDPVNTKNKKSFLLTAG